MMLMKTSSVIPQSQIVYPYHKYCIVVLCIVQHIMSIEHPNTTHLVTILPVSDFLYTSQHYMFSIQLS